jgi:hypothetical protein
VIWLVKKKGSHRLSRMGVYRCTSRPRARARVCTPLYACISVCVYVCVWEYALVAVGDA